VVFIERSLLVIKPWAGGHLFILDLNTVKVEDIRYSMGRHWQFLRED